MTIRITEDEDESGGFAFVDLGRLTSSPLLSFRRQDAEPRHLGSDGWQSEVAWLAPLSIIERDGRAVARFGPSVVDHIEELVPIEIVAQDGTSFGVVSWPFITPAPAGQGLLAAPLTAQPNLTQAGAKGSGVAGTADAAPGPEAIAESQPAPQPTPPNVVEGPPVPVLSAVRPTRRGPPIAALLVLALVGAAGAGGYVYRDDLRALFDKPSPPQRAEVTPPPPAEPPATPEAPRLSAAELRQRYSRLLAERAASPAFVALGDTALAARQGAPAFRAFEEADPVTNADAAWQLARFYDPDATEAVYRETARPNVTRSAYYYALWRNRSPRHTDALRKLCEANAELAGRDERLRAFCRP